MLNERWDTNDLGKERREEYVRLLKINEETFTLNERWDTNELDKEIREEYRREEYVRLLKIRKEEREITKYLPQALNIKDSLPECYCAYYYIITKNKSMYDILQFYNSYDVSSGDAYVYVAGDFYDRNDRYYHPVTYYYPFLYWKFGLVYAYLSKLGIKEVYIHIAPATGLKYVAIVNQFTSDKRAVIEIADIDIVATNLNLPTLAQKVLDTKSSTEYIDYDIVDLLEKQKYFAGYTFNEAEEIVNRYFRDNDTSLAKEVENIKYAYYRVFRPFRAIYDTKTKQFQNLPV